MSDVADENRRKVVTCINRYLDAMPMAMLVPGLDDRMSEWLVEKGCERKSTIYLGTFVVFPDVRTQVLFKITFGVGKRVVE
jgi:hypothetical protein